METETVDTSERFLNRLRDLYNDDEVRNIIVKSSNEKDNRILGLVINSLKKDDYILYFVTSATMYNLKSRLKDRLGKIPTINLKDKINFLGLDTFFYKFPIDKSIKSFATEQYGDYDDCVLFGDGDNDASIFFPVQDWLKSDGNLRKLEFILQHCETKKNILLTMNVSDEEEQCIYDDVDVKLVLKDNS
ncbi:hypothetical protein [Liquorilactobacillus hordei]|uniref:hypothetical protein n=1 Tax=Liquorilactobacillus hordei TaxID=468911 RepID=UPI001CBFF172|nr:hypothetical protein [Liquorilactobacillus hordei]MBZ2405133.1 hypothetical protein [Liquorilactobacillus hordei]